MTEILTTSIGFTRFLLALSAVIVLILGTFWAIARFGRGTRSGKERRLKIKEVLPIDPKRRLVLISWDDKEFLLMLGANGETILNAINISETKNDLGGVDAQVRQAL